MQKTTVIIFSLIFPMFCIGQDSLNLKIDSLKFVSDIPYICHSFITENDTTFGNGPGCGDDLFWEIVKEKEKAIPYLIDKLGDSTMTRATVPNFPYNYTVADVAYSVLGEIIHDIPTFELLGVEFDKEGCGYCTYWIHLAENIQNRERFRDAIENWYTKNKENFVWIIDGSFGACDCSGPHPNNGHFKLEK
jgi:hypothetical protein